MSDTTGKDNELHRMITYQLYDGSIVDHKMAAIINKAFHFIKQYGIQERIVGGEEALNGIATHAATGGRKTVDVSWLMSASGQEWVRYWLEDAELTALKDKEED